MRTSLAFARGIRVIDAVHIEKPLVRNSIAASLTVFILALAGCSPRQAAAPGSAAAGEDPVLARAMATVVRIEAVRLSPSQGRMVKASVGGSGAIITPEGHVLTNYHVADDAEYYVCHLNDGTICEARLVGEDAMSDLAVLKLDLSQRPASAGPLSVAAFGDSDRLHTGDEVIALGSPASLAQAVTKGVVSNVSLVLPKDIEFVLDGENVGLLVRWILHDASIFPGNSGGPLVDARGDIVGINEIGVARLGGAISGNLAREVAHTLIREGRVTRGWSGLTVQPRLKGEQAGPGVLVADIAPDSPAARAGLEVGALIVACGGRALTATGEAALTEYYRMELAGAPGSRFQVEIESAGGRRPVEMELTARTAAQGDDVELRAWGAVLRDITRTLARDQRMADAEGVWVENVRPGGSVGQAEPEMRREDVIVSVDGETMKDLAALRAITSRLLPEGVPTRVVLVGFRRGGALMNSVVELRQTTERRVTPQARRAWLGVVVQTLTAKLATRLGIAAESGVRITQVFPGTRAEAAGLRVGDVVVAIDDAPVTARTVEESESFARQIRQYRVDTEVALTLWRDGQKTKVPVALERQPVPGGEMPAFVDDVLEFTVREVAFEDRTRLRTPDREGAVLVESIIPSGWAALAGLRADDIILRTDGEAVADLAAYQARRDAALAGGKDWLVLQVERAGQTLFVQINLKAIRS
jgi:serine protease Do